MTIIIEYNISEGITLEVPSIAQGIGWNNILNKPSFFADLLIESPQENDVLMFDGSNWINSPAGAGTESVTSVAIASSVLTITGSPITSSGTITVEIDNSAIAISKVNGLQTALDGKLNTGITTSSINDSSNRRYVSDAQLVVIGNTSGTNTGDQDLSNYFNVVGNSLDDIDEGTTNKHFTATLKTKLDGIASGAEVNVNADWNSVSGDSQILNKPTIPTALADLTGTMDDIDDGLTYIKTENNFSDALLSKLNGIASGATANQTDAHLLSRANHTGLQAIATITDLQTTLDAKEATIAAGTTAQYWRGDKSWQTLDKTAVGLSNVANTDTTNASNISSGTLSDSRLNSTVTVQGNTFNTANKLVQLNDTGKLPAVDGSLLTGLPSGVTNLSYSSNSTTATIASDTGTDAVVTAATGSVAGLLLPTEYNRIVSSASENIVLPITYPVSSGVYVLDFHASRAYTINSLTVEAESGTSGTATVAINAVNVTGLAAISFSSVKNTTNATANNSVATTNKVELTINSLTGTGRINVSLNISYA